MDRILLRRLTEKSVLGFGKFADSTVGHIIGYNQFNYLRWVYYNMSNIDFMPDVLDKLNVPVEHRISKPGKDPEKHEVVFLLNSQKMSGLSKFREKLKRKSRAKVRSRLSNMRENKSKAYLRSQNQW